MGEPTSGGANTPPDCASRSVMVVPGAASLRGARAVGAVDEPARGAAEESEYCCDKRAISLAQVCAKAGVLEASPAAASTITALNRAPACRFREGGLAPTITLETDPRGSQFRRHLSDQCSLGRSTTARKTAVRANGSPAEFVR